MSHYCLLLYVIVCKKCYLVLISTYNYNNILIKKLYRNVSSSVTNKKTVLFMANCFGTLIERTVTIESYAIKGAKNFLSNQKKSRKEKIPDSKIHLTAKHLH